MKSVEQQTWSSIHRLRQGYMKERTAAISRIRGLLAEFGLVFPKSPAKLFAALPEVLADHTNELTPLGRTALRRAAAHVTAIDRQIAWCDARIHDHARKDSNARLAMTLFGVGVFTASAVAADLGDLSQFKTAGSSGPGWGSCRGNTRRAASSA